MWGYACAKQTNKQARLAPGLSVTKFVSVILILVNASNMLGAEEMQRKLCTCSCLTLPVCKTEL